jgi:hypothetical protein
MKKLIFLFAAIVLAFNVNAQTKEDVFKPGVELTWLGLDFSQVNFIGSATQWKDAGEITNDQMRDKYFPAWNELFQKEPEKYDVVKATNRSSVKYALQVTEKANNALKRNYFADDANLYYSLDEAKVASLVKKYDFQGNKGLGLIFFVEGMSKGKEQACAWATFVNMDKKEVLWTQRIIGKTSMSIGFRNYWASSFNNMLKDLKKKS